MRRSLTLTCFVLASLSVGSVTYAATTAVPNPDATPLHLVVPVGRLGDVVEFQIHEKTDVWEMNAGQPYEHHTDREFSIAVRAAALVRQPDPTGLMHDALEVHYDGALLEELRTTEFDLLRPIVDLSAMGRNELAKRVIDLDTRHQLKGVQRMTDTRWGTLALELIGPWSDVWRPSEFLYQGLDLTYGQDITAQLYPQGFQVPQEWRNESWSRTASAVVAYQGEFGGEPVLGIREEVWFNETFYTWPTVDGKNVIHWSTVTWVSASKPYPVYRTEQVRADYNDPRYNDTWVDSRTVALGKYQAGDRPIPWSPQMVAHTYRAAVPNLERAPSGTGYPTDGRARLPFPLERALQAVQTDLALPGLRAWQATNAGHRLAGYLLQPADEAEGSTGHQWVLTFAAPDSDTAYRVRSTLYAGTPVPVNQEQGTLLLRTPDYDRRFKAEAFPKKPATIGAAIELWRTVSESADPDSLPTHIKWGYGLYGQCRIPTGRSPTTCSSDAYAANGAPLVLYLDVVQGTPSPPGAPRVVPTEARIEGAIVDIDTGVVFQRRTYDQFWDYAGWIGGKITGDAQPMAAQPATSTPAGPESFVGAAVATTSLLALLLAVYFLPLLKEASARALLALPFYARLRKDELLNNQFRDSILNLVRENPGLDATRIHETVGGGWSTVIYHLGVLEKNSVLSSLVDGRHRYFFPVGDFDFGRRGALAVMQNERTRHIHGLLQEHPGLRRQELAQRVGISVPAIAWHLERLERVGLIGADRARRHHQYYANPTPSTSPPPIGMEFS